jgi:hypothetical protein
MEEELEWERELAKNIKRLCATSSDATSIVVDRTEVRKQKGLVIISGNFTSFSGSTSTVIYDYRNNSFRKGPELKVARYDHASVTLPNGDVAMFGGYNISMIPKTLSSCEVFDVESNSFSIVGDMFDTREGPAAVLLPNGLVLITGGYHPSGFFDSCEFFNPEDNKFFRSRSKMTVGRGYHTASLLPDGRVLVCGGLGTHGTTLKTTEIYDPSTDSFSAGPLMPVGRYSHTATTLVNGRILFAGGEEGTSYNNSTDMYDPTNNSFSVGPETNAERLGHFSATLPDGRVLIGGGSTSYSNRTAEIYDPATDSFIFSGTTLLRPCSSSSAALF